MHQVNGWCLLSAKVRSQGWSPVGIWVAPSIPPHPCLFSPCAARKLQGLSPAPTHRLGFLQAELHRYISGLSCDCHSQNKSELPERRRDIVTPGCRPLGQKVPHVCLVCARDGPKAGKPLNGPEAWRPGCSHRQRLLAQLVQPLVSGWVAARPGSANLPLAAT